MISLMEDVMFAYGTAPALAGKYQAGKHIIQCWLDMNMFFVSFDVCKYLSMLVSNASRQCLQQQIQMQDKVSMPAIKMIFPHDEQSAIYSGDMGDAEASKPHKLARIVCMGRGRGGHSGRDQLL